VGLIAISSEMKALNVGSGMVEDALGSKVIKTGRSRLEFKAQ
jgi:hypothetical protein